MTAIKECPYEREELINFEEGLFGFENDKSFLPLPISEDSDAIINMVSVEDETLSFIIMNPFRLMKDYEPQLTKEMYQKLGTDKEEELSYYVICALADEFEMSTVNLKCPIVVNTVTRKAVQVILESKEYDLRHALKDLKKEEV